VGDCIQRPHTLGRDDSRSSIISFATSQVKRAQPLPNPNPSYGPPLLVIAIILGVILAAVIFLAVKSYLKNKDDEKVGS